MNNIIDIKCRQITVAVPILLVINDIFILLPGIMFDKYIKQKLLFYC